MEDRPSFSADSSETRTGFWELIVSGDNDNSTLQRENSRVNVESECTHLLPQI